MESLFAADDKFDVVISSLEARGWHRTLSPPSSSSPPDLLWTNLKNVDWTSMRPEQLVNHLRGSQHLSNKAFLAYHMHMSGYAKEMPRQWSSAYQDLGELIGMVVVESLREPAQTVASLSELERVVRVLGTDTEWSRSSDGQLVKELLQQQQQQQQQCPSSSSDEGIWIVKPVGGSCGSNIQVVQGLLALLTAVKRDMHYKCVVQKYIERPLLLTEKKRKFDIRQWVLVTSIEPLVIYGFSEFYCRLSSQPYTISAVGLADPTIHLCNHAIQKKSQGGGGGGGGGSVGEDDDEDDDGRNMLTHAQFDAELQSQLGADGALTTESILLPQIRRIAVRTVASVRDKLERIGCGFEWLGLDLMVTEALDVRLIECNVSPDISRSTPVTSRLVRAAVDDILCLLLDHRPPPPSKEGMAWQLWHGGGTAAAEGATEGGTVFETFSPNYLAFARSKRDQCILGKDYAPKKEDLAERVLRVLEQVGREGEEGEEEEEM